MPKPSPIMMPKSLKGRLWLFSALTSLPLLVLALGYATVLAHQLIGERAEDVVRDTRSMADIIERELSNYRRMAEAIARLPAVGVDVDGLTAHARQLNAADGIEVFAERSDGSPWFSSFPSLSGAFAEEIASGPARQAGRVERTTVSNLMSFAQGQQHRIVISTPITRGDERLGTLHLFMRPSRFDPPVRQIEIPRGARWAVVDAAGVILARSENPEQFVGKPVPPALLDSQTGAAGSHWTVGIDNDRLLRTWAYTKSVNWYVSIGMPLAIKLPPLTLTATAGVLALIAAVAITGLLTTVLVRSIVTPVTTLVAQAAEPSDTLDAHPASIEVREFEAIGRSLMAHARLKSMLQRELEHRTRNHLSVMQSLVMSTVRAPRDCEEAREVLLGRLAALGRANTLQLKAQLHGANLRALVDDTMKAFSGRYTASGGDVRLGPKAAQGCALILHELATNALKHGAVSVPNGTVTIAWATDHEGLAIEWSEAAGPTVEPPTRMGLGMSLIRNILGREAKVEVSFDPGGLKVRIWLPQDVAMEGRAGVADGNPM